MSTLALEHLYDAVVARFAADAAASIPATTPPPNLFGWREAAQKMIVGRRIVWIPGDPAGNLGALNPPRNPGRNPRPLATLEELCTIEITTEDSGALQSERLQYRAVRELYDAWMRAVYLAAHGTFRIVSSGWITDKKELRRGAALRIVIAVQAVVADAPLEAAPVDTQARIATSLVDTVEATSVEVTSTEPSVVDEGGDILIDEDGNVITEEAP